MDIKTVHLGPAEILVAAKIDITAKQEEIGYQIINEIEAKIRSFMPDKKMYIYIETDEYDPHYMEKRRNLCPITRLIFVEQSQFFDTIDKDYLRRRRINHYDQCK